MEISLCALNLGTLQQDSKYFFNYSEIFVSYKILANPLQSGNFNRMPSPKGIHDISRCL